MADYNVTRADVATFFKTAPLLDCEVALAVATALVEMRREVENEPPKPARGRPPGSPDRAPRKKKAAPEPAFEGATEATK